MALRASLDGLRNRSREGMASRMARMDWMVLENMISLYESRSESLYPPW